MDGNFRVGQWLVQPQLNLIQGPGGDTSVEPKAMEVLVCLAKQANEVVSKERLMQTVWADTFVTDEVLTNSIWELRKAFGDDAKNPKVIQTVFKKGYRLIAPVSSEGRNEKTGAGHEPQLVDDSREVPTRRVSAKWILLAIVFTLIVAAAMGVRLMRQAPSVPAPELRAVPLTSFPGNEVQPTLAPDGNQVAFVWNGAENGDNYDIYVKVIGSEKLLRLTTHPAKDISPAWSPDGRQIAFIRQSGNQRSVIFIAALGGSERTVYTAQERIHIENVPGSPGTNQSLAWSPDGKLVALTESPIESKESRIVLISPDTDKKRTLLSSSLASVYQYANPRFSPDGRVLAFVWAANPGISDVYTLAVAGGKPKRLTFANSHVFGLDFTADGRHIIFSSGSLWRIPVSGGQPERLAGIESDALSPAFARRGNSLVYSYSRRDGNIWKLDVSRSPATLEQMPISSTRGDGNPQFSPDGRRIAFTSGRSGSGEIWTSDADGSNLRQVTSPHTQVQGPPRWSPDGQSIVFNSDVEGNHNIYTMSKEGGPTKQLTTEASQDVHPSWSTNGRWIYFGSNRSGEWQVWKIPSGGGNAIPVTKHDGRQAVESIDGKFVYYVKASDIAGLWRVPAEGGGEEVSILDQPVQGYWATLDEGIYFLARSPVPTVRFYSFNTKQTKELAVVGKEIPWGYPGFSVSPDGKQIIYSQIDRVENDLMLVENFR